MSEPQFVLRPSGTQPAPPGGGPEFILRTGDTPESRVATGATKRPEDLHKFPCKQCGADLQYAPGQTVLQCPYCGFREEIPTTEAAIREYHLEEALLNLPRTQGWGTERRALHCENCGATTTFSEGQVAGQCAFCGSSKVVQEGSSANVIRPETLVPFMVKREQAAELFRKWISSLWFRPNDLKHAGQLGKLSGAYLPFWTYDAYTNSHWTADAGYHYYETETYQERDANGNMVTRTRQVQKTRWVPASGYRNDFFDDELICASKGLPVNLIDGVCPYNLESLAPYEPSYLAGFVAEEYQIDLAGGWALAKDRIQSQVNSLCAADVPGDTHRNLNVNTAYSGMRYKHLLLPVWVSAYLYNGKTYRFLVNGQTGKTTGEAPLSWWKIAGLIIAILIVILIIVLLTSARGGSG